ncbi:MAG: SRPBCC domain-containing protein [Caldilineaceae bacterium]
MKEFSATTTIHASPETIWAILTDAPSYPEWDPYAERIEGRIAAGETIKAYTKLSLGRAFPVKVTEFVPGQRMTWSGGMPLGLFKGIRTFVLAPQANGAVQFTVRELFSGPLLPLIGRSLPDMTEPFAKFAAGLKARAENKQS